MLPTESHQRVAHVGSLDAYPIARLPCPMASRSCQPRIPQPSRSVRLGDHPARVAVALEPSRVYICWQPRKPLNLGYKKPSKVMKRGWPLESKKRKLKAWKKRNRKRGRKGGRLWEREEGFRVANLVFDYTQKLFLYFCSSCNFSCFPCGSSVCITLIYDLWKIDFFLWFFFT